MPCRGPTEEEERAMRKAANDQRNQNDLRENYDQAVRVACNALNALESGYGTDFRSMPSGWLSHETRKWWEDHKEFDARRKAREEFVTYAKNFAERTGLSQQELMTLLQK